MSRKKRRVGDDVNDYEDLFRETEVHGVRKCRFFSRMLLKNFGLLLLSSVFYIFKAAPVWVSSIVTANIVNSITDLIKGAIANEAAVRSILINAAVFIFMMLQNIPSNMVWARLCSKLFRENSAKTRSAVVKKLQRLSITYHKEMETGKVQSKFLRDVEGMDNLVANTTNVLLPAVFGVIISVVIAIFRSGTVTLFFLVVIPVNVALAFIFRRKMTRNSYVLRKDSEAVAEKMSTLIEMLPVTKAHGLEEHEYKNFRKDIDRLQRSGKTLDVTNANFGATAWVLSNLLTGFCILFCAYLAYLGKIEVGDIVLFQSLFSMISNNVIGLINVMPAMMQGLDSVRSLSELMNTTDVEESHAGDTPSIAGEIEFKNVSYRYPDADRCVLKNFSLHVHPGECIAVVGGSGSGKSTLMNMIIGFLKPTEGELLIDGTSIAGLDLSTYRHDLSVVPQNSILFAGSIRDNITYGLERYTEEDLKRVVEMSDIEEFLKELPNGIDTNIGEHGGRLSGGQRQRVSIARALIRDPRILILDEATSALDNISEYHVQKAIASMIKGRTTFIVAHRLSTIRDADRIVVLEEGEAVEIGTYEELMEKQGKFYELKTLSDISYREAEAALQ